MVTGRTISIREASRDERFNVQLQGQLSIVCRRRLAVTPGTIAARNSPCLLRT
jgi:hypothetical protein